MGILLTLIILGAMAVLVLRFTTNKTLVPAAKSAPTAAARAVCEYEVSALNQAVSDYRRLNGSSPPPGRGWAITTVDGGPWIQSWPGVAHEFAIGWNGHGFVVTTPFGHGCAKA
ncbi:MAG TPA: hypothetical protein VGS61_04850 [Acidimicrobiales bacterium]|nr:hypothetical protein [Acidimicrobiales bacterium]